MSATVLFALMLFKAVAVSGRDFCVLCYFTNWAQYLPNPGSFTPGEINPRICTHIMYAFGNITETLNVTTREWNDETFYVSVKKLKESNPNLKILLSVGGATVGSTVFHIAVNSNTNMTTFARNAVTFLRRYQFDGLDVDWEFPGENYTTNFTTFLATIRSEFDTNANETGQARLLLTVAVSAYKPEMERSYEVKEIHRYLDYISIMGYDYYGIWSQTLGHNSPLYVPEADRNSSESSLLSQNASVTYWLEAGTPKEKLVLGISTYARTFRMNGTTDDIINQTRPGSLYDTGKGGDPGLNNHTGVLSYYEVCPLLSNFTRVWMEDSQVPYAFGPRNGHWEWIAYDDIQSMAAKANYIIKYELGGAMFWTLDSDDFKNLCGNGSFPLITEVSRILNATTTTTTATTTTATTTTTKKPEISGGEGLQQPRSLMTFTLSVMAMYIHVLTLLK